MMNFFYYFGLIGTLSVVLWLASMGLAGAAILVRPRVRWAVLAVICGVMALWVAKWNSHYVSAIEVDPAEEHEKRLAEQQKEAKKAGELGPKRLQFAESGPLDDLDSDGPAGDSIYAKAARGEEVPAYKQKGKQVREGSEVPASEEKPVSESGDHVRYMKEKDMIAANNLDRFNLGVARLVVWGAVILLLGVYVFEFNALDIRNWPIPIAGLWVDELSPKTLFLRWRDASPAEIEDFLAHAIRKGESFIWLGGETELKAIARVHLHDSVECWKMPVRHFSEFNSGDDYEYVFESAWFRRSSFVIGDEQSRSFMDFLFYFLDQRQVTRAKVTASLNLILPVDLLDGDEALRLRRLAKSQNIRVILHGKGLPWKAKKDTFDGNLGVAGAV